MAIKQGDIKFYKAQRMTQDDNGGGKISNYELVSGRSEELFDAPTEINRVSGDIQLSKLFASVKTYGDAKIGADGQPIKDKDGNTLMEPEKFLDANMIITENAEDPAISALLFTTDNTIDTVIEAKNRISAHLNKTTRISGELDGVQLKGARQITLLTKLTVDPPLAGETICIVQDEGTTSEIEQYLKIDKVESKQQEVVVKRGDEYTSIQLKRVSISLFMPLEYDFDGGEVTGVDSTKNRAYLRATQVTDAGRYHGCSDLKKEAKIGDMIVQVTDIYGQLIPPMETQANIVDQQAGSDTSPLIGSDGVIRQTVDKVLGPNVMLWLSRAIKPNTLQIAYSGAMLTDKEGQLMNGDMPIGHVDYHSGTVTFGSNAPTINGRKTVTCGIAVAPTRISDTMGIKVTEGNRGYSYNEMLFPPPAPGSTTVAFAVLGKWYEMKDSGDGVLRGVENNGVGRVNFSTGSIELTLPELPDIDSSIMINFGSKVNYIDRGKDYQNGTLDSSKMRPRFTAEIGKEQIVKGSLVLTWGNKKRATDNGRGQIVGDATGTVNYAKGLLDMMFNELPAQNVLVHATCSGITEDAVKVFRVHGYGGGGNSHTFNLSDKFLKASSVQVRFNVVSGAGFNGSTISAIPQEEIVMYANDNGIGGLILTDETPVGTIDYDAGIITLNTQVYVKRLLPFSKDGVITGYQWVVGVAEPATDGTQYVIADYAIGESDDLYETDLKFSQYELNLTPTYQETIVPGSVMFTFGGKTYVDVNGRLECDFDPTIGQGTYAGYVNYENGEVNLIGWNSGTDSQIHIQSLFTAINIQPVSRIDFRVRAAPIRTGSLQINAIRTDGVRLEGRADEGSKIQSAAMEGEVNISNGVVSIKFGEWINVESLLGEEEWFDPKNIINGKVWWPWFVYADTVKFNAVATKFAAVDPKVLKINPNRLPNNGKVQIIRNGDLVALHEEVNVNLPNNAPAGLEFELKQYLLTDAWVEDFNGTVLPADFYEIDHVTGKGKLLKAPSQDYLQPLKAVGNIEEQNSVADVQINGQVSLTKPLTHNFSQNAKLSGVLFFGTLQSGYKNLFEQNNHDQSNWQDYMTGAPVSWKFNDIEYPIEVTNAGAINQRWALVFTTKTNFNIIGETEGIVGTGSTTSDCSPIRSGSGEAYFTIRKGAWGVGQEPGNVLRFETVSATANVWLIRSIVPSDERKGTDYFNFRFGGYTATNNKAVRRS